MTWEKRRQEKERERAMRDISRIPPIKIRTSSTRPNRVASREVLIAAPAGLCFETIAKQLERPASWDTLIVHVWPVSILRSQAGATSRVLVNFGGQLFHSAAMISQYEPDRVVSWVLDTVDVSLDHYYTSRAGTQPLGNAGLSR